MIFGSVLTWVLEWLVDKYDVQVTPSGDGLLLSFKRKRLAVGFKFFNELGKEIMALKLKDDEKATASIKPVDKKGFPAQVDDVPVWAASAEGIVELTPAADGLSCVIAGMAPGACQVNVTADADLGDGVRNITGTLDVEVLGGDAVTINIETGAVEPQ